jgi:hypothetical protein
MAGRLREVLHWIGDTIFGFRGRTVIDTETGVQKHYGVEPWDFRGVSRPSPLGGHTHFGVEPTDVRGHTHTGSDRDVHTDLDGFPIAQTWHGSSQDVHQDLDGFPTGGISSPQGSAGFHQFYQSPESSFDDLLDSESSSSDDLFDDGSSSSGSDDGWF